MFRFIKRLQNSDETTKRRWLFVLSGIAMVAVVFIWLAYFNNLVSGFAETETVEIAQAETRKFSFWGTARGSLAVISQTFWGFLQAFGEILGEPREYIINPS